LSQLALQERDFHPSHEPVRYGQRARQSYCITSSNSYKLLNGLTNAIKNCKVIFEKSLSQEMAKTIFLLEAILL